MVSLVEHASAAPTAEQLGKTRQRIDAYIQTIASSPDRREGAFPYYLFHEANPPSKERF